MCFYELDRQAGTEVRTVRDTESDFLYCDLLCTGIYPDAIQPCASEYDEPGAGNDTSGFTFPLKKIQEIFCLLG